MAKGKAGGGIRSKNVVRKPVRTGQQRERIRPSGVAQIGQRQGNHITEQGATSYGGIGLRAGQGFPSELGNTIAARTVCCPGGSRTIHRSGSQATQGAVNPGQPMQPKGEIFPGFGPNKRS